MQNRKTGIGPHRFWQRTLSVFLCLCLGLSAGLLSVLPAFAETDSVPDKTYFLTDSLKASMGILSVPEDQPEARLLTIRGANATVYGTVTPVESPVELNALRIILQNETSCEKMVVSYRYRDGNGQEIENTETVSIHRRSEKRTYYVLVPDACAITFYSLTFSGVRSGNVRLYSVNRCSSVPTEVQEEHGVISTCAIEEGLGFITVGGTVKYDATVVYKNARLGLFYLESGQVLSAICEDASIQPLETTPLTNRFSFRISVNRFSQYFGRYAVCILNRTPDGEERIPLTYPKYVLFSSTDELSGATGDAYKGIETGLHELAIENLTESAILDVYFNRLLQKEGGDVSYTLLGNNVYFRRSYLERLDSRIQNYVTAGTKVYLRFLWDESVAASSEGEEEAHSPIYRIKDEETSFSAFAVVSFLAERYQQKLAGVVWGSQIDLKGLWDTEKLPAQAFADRYTHLLCLSLMASRYSNLNLPILIPVSGTGWDDILSEEENSRHYALDLLLDNLLEYLSRSLLSTEAFSLLVEMEGSLGIRSGMDPSELESTRYMEQLKNHLGTGRNGTPWQIPLSFDWQIPAGMEKEALSALYAYLYYSLENEYGVRTFFVSLPGDAGQSIETFGNLKELYATVNTSSGWKETGNLCTYFGQAKWSDLIPSFREENLPVYAQNQVLFRDQVPGTVRGTYDYFSFAVATGTLNWKPGFHCLSLNSRFNDGLERVLSAEMDLNSADRSSSIYYSFSRPENLTIGDYISFRVLIEGEEGASYRLTVTFLGVNGVTKAYQTVEANRETVLVLPTSGLIRCGGINTLRLSVSSDTAEDTPVFLFLKKMSVHSESRGDDKLKEEILQAHFGSSTSQNRDDSLNFTSAHVIAIISAVLLIGMFTLLVISRRRSQKSE